MSKLSSDLQILKNKIAEGNHDQRISFKEKDQQKHINYLIFNLAYPTYLILGLKIIIPCLITSKIIL